MRSAHPSPRQRQYEALRAYFIESRPAKEIARAFGYSVGSFHVLDLGHDEPTILLTNQQGATSKGLLTRYAQRMLIENALSDAVRFFHIDALSSEEALKVDFDMTLLVIASGLYRLLAERMRGYADAQARQIFRDLIDMPADVIVTEQEVMVSFHRRTHLPIILASGLMKQRIAVPCWNGRRLRLTTYNGPANQPGTQANSFPWKSRLGYMIIRSIDCWGGNYEAITGMVSGCALVRKHESVRPIQEACRAHGF